MAARPVARCAHQHHVRINIKRSVLILIAGRSTVGIFDKMFGSDASVAESQPETQKRFEELKQKYQSVLSMVDQQQVQLRNLHVQDNKLFNRGAAPSEDAKNRVWDQIKLVDPQFGDIAADIIVDEKQTASGGQTYTVKPGDTLSKISKQFYGNPNEYMHIFYANREKLKDPDQIQVGQQLTIPPA
jgi:LysM repeat protein